VKDPPTWGVFLRLRHEGSRIRKRASDNHESAHFNSIIFFDSVNLSVTIR
jgi:hypothetical protein